MAQRSALGKGLGAILGEIEEVKESPAAVSEIPVSKISPNPYQPRTEFSGEALKELADSIRALGIIQPLTLRSLDDGTYQIISGERRFRASRMAGLDTVPAYIRNADDGSMLELAIVENIQRENLDAIETALGFRRLMEECNLTQDEMARRVGKKRTTVANFLRLLRLPPEVQKAVKCNAISAGHARALLQTDDGAVQKRLCANAIKFGWSVRTMEAKVRQSFNPARHRTGSGVPLWLEKAEGTVRKFGGTLSSRSTKEGGSSITLNFRSQEDAENFIKNLF